MFLSLKQRQVWSHFPSVPIKRQTFLFCVRCPPPKCTFYLFDLKKNAHPFCIPHSPVEEKRIFTLFSQVKVQPKGLRGLNMMRQASTLAAQMSLPKTITRRCKLLSHSRNQRFPVQIYWAALFTTFHYSGNIHPLRDMTRLHACLHLGLVNMAVMHSLSSCSFLQALLCNKSCISRAVGFLNHEIGVSHEELTTSVLKAIVGVLVLSPTCHI